MFERRFSAKVRVAFASLLGLTVMFVIFLGLAQAQSGPSISVAYSPNNSVPPSVELRATFTLNNLDPTAYSSLTLVATIKRYSMLELLGVSYNPVDWVHYCHGVDLNSDHAIAVDSTTEEISIQAFKPCGFGNYGHYTLTARLYQEDPDTQDGRVEIASAKSRFAMSYFLADTTVTATPPGPHIAAWLEPDPRTITFRVHDEPRTFVVRADLLQYLPDHLSVFLNEGGDSRQFASLLGSDLSPEEVCQQDEYGNGLWKRAINQGVSVVPCKAGQASFIIEHETGIEYDTGVETSLIMYKVDFQVLPALDSASAAAPPPPSSPSPPPPPPPAVSPPPPPRSGGGGSSPRNRAPEFRDGGKAERTVSENVPSGSLLGDPIEARDGDDEDVLVYSLGGVDAALFSIDSADGQLSTTAEFDFESHSAYEIIVSVTDGKSSRDQPNDDEDDFIEVTIKVRNADEPGVVTLSNYDPYIDSGIAAVLEDADGNLRDVEWLWERSAHGETWVELASGDGSSFTPDDDDIGGFLRVTATYSDVHGSGKAAAAVTNATVVANTVPGFPTDEPIERAVREHGAGETGGVVGEPVVAADQDGDALIYSLDGDDAALFEIDAATGQIILNDDLAPDYETRESYRLTVTVMDGRDERGDADSVVDDEISVLVRVENLDEAGTLAPSLRNPRVGAEFSVELSDPDGGIVVTEWRWDRSPTIESGRATWTPINGAHSASYSPLATDAGHFFRVSATYTDGHGPFKNAQLIVVGAVLDFTGPIFVGADAGSVSLSVEENATGDTTVGEPVTAESVDGQITYALSGPDAGVFTVDVESGQIRVADGALLEYEQSADSYELAITATDGRGQAVSMTVLVQLSDVALPGLVGRYDADNDERISRAEALAAVADYFEGTTTREELDDVLAVYGGG